MGAWRDLSRAEAILELIDNSIDAWMRRAKRYPGQTAENLMIFIDVDTNTHILTYEDNAGGVDEESLINLVVPGHSETLDLDRTIGSYRTGGKKAIFKLASEANIWTRYWHPVGTTDEAYEVHLDRRWLQDSTEYEFVYGSLVNKSSFKKGQTVYKFRLHESAADWDASVIKQIVTEIRRNYTLLMLRNPKIEIYFMDRSKPLEPFEDIYKFTGACDEERGLDLRPQRVRFKTKIESLGQTHDVVIEIVLGCRTTSASKEKEGEDGVGIDLYGNDRLFVYQAYELFRDWYDLPKGSGRGLVRGYINVLGPNFLIPWDTHKRHLNPEREVMQVLRTHPAIRQFFDQWGSAYKALALAPDIKKTISEPISPWRKKNDLNISFSDDIDIAAGRRRGAKLPPGIHVPLVPIPERVERPIEVKLAFSEVEFKMLCKEYDIEPQERDASKQLAEVTQEFVISQIL